MVSVATEVEIAAPPAKVREVFLDFAKYSEWSHSHIKSIQTPAGKTPDLLQAGDKLKVSLSGMKFSPTVNSNTAEEFSWTGALPLNLFSGLHTFRFEPSQITPGHTTFRDGEKFSGMLTSVFGGSKKGDQGSKKFEAFDQELKRRVESLHSASA